MRACAKETGSALILAIFLNVATGIAQTRAVDVIVKDPNGRTVANLLRDDFRVEENGVPTSIGRFDTVDAPWHLLLLLDVRIQFDQARVGIDAFVSHLRPQDRFAVAGFGHTAEMLVDWRNRGTGKHVEIRRGLETGAGAKDFYGAVEWATERMKKIGGRKAVIILTDGEDARLEPMRFTVDRRGVIDPLFGLPNPAEAADFASTLGRVRESGIRFHIIAGLVQLGINRIYPGIEETLAEYTKRIRSRLQSLADASGGRLFYDTSLDVAQRYSRLYDDLGLGASYTLEYATRPSGADDDSRQVEVHVRNRELAVHTSRERPQ